jgi:hypothetical protein
MTVFLAVGLFMSIAGVQAQKLSKSDIKELTKKEDSIKAFSQRMVFDEEPGDRFRADSNFIRGFVRALKIKNSFYYPFDSLNISRLYAPDSSFRIFTWQMKKDEYVYIQKGAIQMNTPDGSLKLFNLFDNSMFTSKPTDSARTRDNWIGAIYYRIILKEHQGKKYYTLLGFDDFTISSNKKWMEVLSFDANGQPVFGGPVISFKDDTLKRPVQARFNIEYKKEAKTTFNYDPNLDLIVYDHLISETGEPNNKSSYIPDGDYEAFKWVNGQWLHIDKVFDFKLRDGEAPLESKIRDANGNIDETQLEAASQRNIQKAEQTEKSKPATKKPATPVKKKTDNN